MTVRIRLARSGTKKRPFYRIVATSSRNSRDGGFLEKLGTYDPILPSDSPKRIVLREERVRYWLGVGAQPSDRVARFLDNAGITESAARWRGTGKRAEEIAARKAGEAAAEAAPAGSSAPAEAKAPAPETQAKAAAEDPKVEAADAEAAPETEEAAAPATVESDEAAEPKVAAQDVGAAPESAGAAEGEVAPDTPGADEPAKPAADAS